MSKTSRLCVSWFSYFSVSIIGPSSPHLLIVGAYPNIAAHKFAKAAGATVIATTSSKEKEKTLKKLGADHVINYKEDENWGTTAKELTGGLGVHHVIEVGGAGTLKQSLKAIRYEGIITIVGFLGGVKVESSLMECLTYICTARGVYVGSRQQMEEMVAAIEANDIHPVVDPKQFTLDQVREAYEYQVSYPVVV
jgi:NADPH:quinone reductase-like Zn-dependent oxidoreductase